jgi:hypothetical protein
MAVISAQTSADELRARWAQDGWFLLSSFVPESDVKVGFEELMRLYPSAESVWREPDPVLKAEQFAGICEFPFDPQVLNRLALHESIAGLAATLLGEPNIVLYMAHAWAKYAGAADYDQLLHRDFRNHTLAVPDQTRPEYAQVEMMLYLEDVEEKHGPTHLVSRRHTRDVPLHPEFLPRDQHARLYELEESAAGPAGSLLVYSPDVIHRGTNLTGSGARRGVVAMGYQRRGHGWMGYHCWPKKGSYPPMIDFVETATPRQLELLGFPLPEDPYWTPVTVSATRERYPRLDLDAYLRLDQE